MLIQSLNMLRNHLVNTTDWAKQETQVMTTSPYGIAIMKGPVVTIMTNIGSPVRIACILVTLRCADPAYSPKTVRILLWVHHTPHLAP